MSHARSNTHTHAKGSLFITASKATHHQSPQGDEKLGYVVMKDVGNDDSSPADARADGRITSVREVNNMAALGLLVAHNRNLFKACKVSDVAPELSRTHVDFLPADPPATPPIKHLKCPSPMMSAALLGGKCLMFLERLKRSDT